MESSQVKNSRMCTTTTQLNARNFLFFDVFYNSIIGRNFLHFLGKWIEKVCSLFVNASNGPSECESEQIKWLSEIFGLFLAVILMSDPCLEWYAWLITLYFTSKQTIET